MCVLSTSSLINYSSPSKIKYDAFEQINESFYTLYAVENAPPICFRSLLLKSGFGLPPLRICPKPNPESDDPFSVRFGPVGSLNYSQLLRILQSEWKGRKLQCELDLRYMPVYHWLCLWRYFNKNLSSVDISLPFNSLIVLNSVMEMSDSLLLFRRFTSGAIKFQRQCN